MILKTDCCFYVNGTVSPCCKYYGDCIGICIGCVKYYPNSKIPDRIKNFTENVVRGVVDQTLIEKEVVLYADAIRKDIISMIEEYNNSSEGD